MFKRPLRRIVLFVLTAALLFGTAPAAHAEQITDDKGNEYSAARVYLDGLLSFRAFYDGTDVFIPFESLCRFFDAEAYDEFDSETGELRTYGDFELSADTGLNYLKVNRRWLYIPEGFRYISGKLCFPLQICARLFGLEFGEYSGGCVYGSSADAQIISGSNTYYEDTFGAEEMLWMTRIIFSEAGVDPLEGMIGVGNTVLNRVASDIYPDNIVDVIFDTETNSQFQPAYDLTINKTPSEESRIAACLCFEGYNTVGDCMYFVERFGFADDSWFKNTKTYYATIGSHDFYA